MKFEESQINGTIIKSFIACRKQGWLASRNISPSRDNVNILMGEAYSQNRGKNKKIGGIEIDEISKGKHIVVKEYKKTFSNIEASKMQLLFYMLTLQKELLLKKVEGYVISEETSEKVYLLLDSENIKKVENMVVEILEIVNCNKPPEFIQTALCLHCGHNFYCL